MKEFYKSLSPNQRLALQVLGLFTVSLASMMINQRIGYKRGYKEGFSDGPSPAKQKELNAAWLSGHSEGFDMGKQAQQGDGYRRAVLDLSEFNRPTAPLAPAPLSMTITHETVPA